MTDFTAFREYQTRSSIIAEKEKSNELRRRTLQELTQNVQQLHEECKWREEQLTQERRRYHNRKNTQDEKVNIKETQGRLQRERVLTLEQEEAQLNINITEKETQMTQLQEEIEQRRHIAGKVKDAKEELTKVKYQLEEKDAQMMRLEAKVEKMEINCEKRHAAVAERLQNVWLPRVAAERGTGLDETAGESILLIDEFN